MGSNYARKDIQPATSSAGAGEPSHRDLVKGNDMLRRTSCFMSIVLVPKHHIYHKYFVEIHAV